MQWCVCRGGQRQGTGCRGKRSAALDVVAAENGRVCTLQLLQLARNNTLCVRHAGCTNYLLRCCMQAKHECKNFNR